MQRTMERLLEIVMTYEDKDGRILSEPFVKLPSRKDLPDYYDVIKRPMDFQRIQAKIRDHKYRGLDQLEEDVFLLCENAQTYNMDGSLIFDDSVILKSVWLSAREKMSKLDQEPVNVMKDDSACNSTVTTVSPVDSSAAASIGQANETINIDDEGR